jgi:tetratricopeptide (TPR) repeat protein
MNIETSNKLSHEANLALQNKDYPEANRILKVLTEKFPENYNFKLNLAATFRELGQPNEAFFYYKEAEKLNNKDYVLYFNLANLLAEDLNHPDESAIYYLESLKLNPDYINAWQNLSLLYVNNDKFDLAIKVCDKILSINSDHFDGNYVKGFSLLSLGSPSNAKIFIEKALSIEYNTGVLRALAEINHMLGNKNEAVKQSAESEGAFVFYSDNKPYLSL